MRDCNSLNLIQNAKAFIPSLILTGLVTVKDVYLLGVSLIVEIKPVFCGFFHSSGIRPHMLPYSEYLICVTVSLYVLIQVCLYVFRRN